MTRGYKFNSLPEKETMGKTERENVWDFWCLFFFLKNQDKKKVRKDKRQVEKRWKSALNNRDINFASVPETLACCHLITVPV